MTDHPVRWRLLTELADSDYRVRELTDLVGEPQSLISYHLRLLRDGGLVTARRSSFDGRDTYYHLDLDQCVGAIAAAGAALHAGLQLTPRPAAVPIRRATPVRVLFACTGNSARSPIAEALLRHRSNGQIDATSAGSHPQQAIHPQALRVLRDQFGIDIAGQSPRHLDTLRRPRVRLRDHPVRQGSRGLPRRRRRLPTDPLEHRGPRRRQQRPGPVRRLHPGSRRDRHSYPPLTARAASHRALRRYPL
jgi:hypothetical protein